jgi:formylglycine-generating enzyme required for sulfatase activity
MKRSILLICLILTLGLLASCQPKSVPPACTAIGQTWLSPKDGMTLLCVPGATFQMGAAASDTEAQTNERPQHPVTLASYWIDQTEVTNRQFGLFVQATTYQTEAEKLGSGSTYNGSEWVDTKGAFWKQPNGPGSDLNGKQEHPVVQVSWNDATAYCKWAERKLPTEAQWELAARGTDGRIYPWEKGAPDATLLNFNMNIKDTTAVGSYPKGVSPYGALDMAGNVWEWVSDWYGETYYASSPTNNPTGPTAGEYKVLRGGSWTYLGMATRASYRNSDFPTYRDYVDGFRCGR